MKKILRKKRSCFTLVEVLVAMAVFSILMMFMMRFFSGTQKLWADAEGQNEVYSDARVAMDFVSTLLENSVTVENKMPFALVKGTFGDDRIYFCTKSPIKLNTNAQSKMFFVVLRIDNPLETDVDKKYPDKLRLAALGDQSSASFDSMFHTATLDTTKVDALLGSGTLNDTCEAIIDRVTGLELTAYKDDMTKYTGSTINQVPYAVTIKLSMLDSNNYRKWKELEGRISEGTNTNSYRFRKQNEREFTRTIYLGDRSYTP